MSEPTNEELRRSIAAELKAIETDLNRAASSGTDAPRGIVEQQRPGGTVNVGYERPESPQMSPDEFRKALGAEVPPSSPAIPPEPYAPRGAQPVPPPPSLAREVLDLASGGGTEAVIAAQEGAGEQAKKDITEKGLSGMTMEQRIAAYMAATGATPQQAQQFVRVNPSWVPGTRTAATGATGMDPAAQDAIFALEKGRGINDEEAFRQGQEADALKHRQMLEVQGNALKAEEAFRRDQTSIQQRYDTERAEQMERLKQVQAAMDSVGKNPRTIREWLDSSGTGTKVTYGLAAALSAIGGAIGRRGNQPLQDLFNRTQAGIDAKVKQEQDTYRVLGEKAKLSDSVYARIRQATQDDTAALNITKAMYYDALGHMVDQVGTQYKLDMQSPQVLDFMSKLSGRYQDLIKETATKFQEQSSQTDRFNPGGVFAVGGAAKSKGPGEGEKDIRKQVEKFGKAMEDRGGNVTGQTIEHLDNVTREMAAKGYDKDEKLWAALAAAAAAKSPVAAAAELAALPPDQRKLVGLLIQSTERRVHKLSGANYTLPEAVRDMFKMGGFSLDGLRSYRGELKAEFDGIVQGIQGTHGGDPDPAGGSRVGNLYFGRQNWAWATDPNAALEGRALNPATAEQRKYRDSARVQ